MKKRKSKYDNYFKIGDNFCNWTVVSEKIKTPKNKINYILCKCKCGKTEKYIAAYDLKNGKILKKEKCCKYNDFFYVGQRFGQQVIVSTEIKRIYKNNVDGILVRCDCGKEHYVEVRKISNNHSCIDCKEMTFEKNPSWKGVGNISGRYFNNLKRNAIRRKLEFDIAIEYLSELYNKQQGKCALTGDNIYFSEARKYKMETSASLDRIDNNKGYIVGNVQFVSKKVNFAKHKTTEEDFIDMCRKVVKIHGEG